MFKLDSVKPRMALVVAFLLPVFCAACAGSLGTVGAVNRGLALQRAAVSPAVPPAGLSLPKPRDIAPALRQSSIEDAQLLDGGQFTVGLPHNNVLDDLGVGSFDPASTPGGPASGLAYAIYEFDAFALATDSANKLHLNWQTKPAEGQYFVGMANFDRNRWDFYSSSFFLANPQAPDTGVFDSAASSSYVDDVNLRALVVVVLSGNGIGRLEDLHINNLDPVLVSTDIPDSGDVGVEVQFAVVATDADSGSISYTWDFGDGSPSEADISPLAAHTYANPGTFDVTVSITDSGGGSPADSRTEPISIVTAGNQPPTVSLTANGEDTLLSGKRPLSVDFVAAANDTDGTVEKYEWDFDGDGIYEVDSGTTAIQSVLFTQHATLDIAVRVTDNQLAQTTDSVQISTDSIVWTFQDIAQSSGRLLQSPKLALIGGRPAVAFDNLTGDASDADISYCRATSDDGDGTWGSVLTVEADATGSLFGPQLSEVNGKPAVLYSLSGSELLYEQAQDATGSTWGATRVSIGTSFTGSLDVVDGFPAASYGVSGGTGNNELRYRRASDANGLTPWGTEAVVDTDSGAEVGGNSSLEVVNGLPGVCFSDTGNGRLLYKRSLDSDGVAWGNVEVISDAGSNTGLSAFLFMLNGNPAAAFCRTSAKVAFSRANSTSGDDWPLDPQPLDDTFINSGVFGAGIYQGLPCIAYQDFSNKKIAFLLAKDQNGTAWNAPEFVTSFGGAGNTEGSFLIVNGLPAIAWNESPSDTLHYAVYK